MSLKKQLKNIKQGENREKQEKNTDETEKLNFCCLIFLVFKTKH